jgi:hypothetical protein
MSAPPETTLHELDARHLAEEGALLRRALEGAAWSLRAAARALAGLAGPGEEGEEGAVGALRFRLRARHPELAAEIPRRRAEVVEAARAWVAEVDRRAAQAHRAA